MGSAFRFPACPLLPEVAEPLGHMVTRVHARVKDGRFYVAALRYAQSLWREGKPAQAILQINKALMADLHGDEEILKRYPPPYRALVWFLENRPEGIFFGNPVRHFQHLATRVSGERKEVRAWRAWACFHLSRRVLPEEGFPRDEKQIKKEGVVVPGWEEVLGELGVRGWEGEVGVLEGCRVIGDQ